MLESIEDDALSAALVGDLFWPVAVGVDVGAVELGFVALADGEAKPVGPKRRLAGKPPLKKIENNRLVFSLKFFNKNSYAWKRFGAAACNR